MPFRYVPILKTKAGEVVALANLSPAAKARVFPLVRATAQIPATFQPNVLASLPAFPMALDGEHNFSAVGSAAPYTALFHGLGTGGIPIIPAVSFDSDPAYLASARQLFGTFAPGAVAQVALVDLPQAQAWCAQRLQAPPSDIDLVITVGDVSSHDPRALAGYVGSFLNHLSTAGNPWRSVALSSYSAARDHGGFPRGRSLAPRRCWQLWNNVSPQRLPFQLDFSDSGHVHPSLEEVPGYAMANATVSVRYTINDNWVVLKGTQIGGANGSPMNVQYRNHARTLTQEQEFNNLSYCWGDDRIRHYATTTGGAGGRPQWVAVLLNRHISHVCDRLP